VILTDRFVFLHLHKSGGSFVNECLRLHVPGARQIGYHLPASLIPEGARHLPVIGLVRNPWSYYVSWFSFQRERPQPNALFRVLSDDGRLDFSGTVNNMLDLGREDALLSRVVNALPSGYGSQGLNLPGFALAPIRGSGLGFYSFLYQYLYSACSNPPHIGRMEGLPGQLLDLFDATGQPASPALREHLLRAPPVNSSRHGAYATYYDPALRNRVAAQDALIIGRHGYAFGA
jgi:hypothetical protein